MRCRPLHENDRLTGMRCKPAIIVSDNAMEPASMAILVLQGTQRRAPYTAPEKTTQNAFVQGFAFAALWVGGRLMDERLNEMLFSSI